MAKDIRWASFRFKLDEASHEPIKLNDHPLTKPITYKFDVDSIPPPIGGWEAGVWYRAFINGESLKAEKVEGVFGNVKMWKKPLSEEEEKKLHELHFDGATDNISIPRRHKPFYVDTVRGITYQAFRWCHAGPDGLVPESWLKWIVCYPWRWLRWRLSEK